VNGSDGSDRRAFAPSRFSDNTDHAGRQPYFDVTTQSVRRLPQFEQRRAGRSLISGGGSRAADSGVSPKSTSWRRPFLPRMMP
jgi:hypothetical protein